MRVLWYLSAAVPVMRRSVALSIAASSSGPNWSLNTGRRARAAAASGDSGHSVPASHNRSASSTKCWYQPPSAGRSVKTGAACLISWNS